MNTSDARARAPVAASSPLFSAISRIPEIPDAA
jgi:hypothetical protein